jgi:hypothetical protein
MKSEDVLAVTWGGFASASAPRDCNQIYTSEISSSTRRSAEPFLSPWWHAARLQAPKRDSEASLFEGRARKDEP